MSFTPARIPRTGVPAAPRAEAHPAGMKMEIIGKSTMRKNAKKKATPTRIAAKLQRREPRASMIPLIMPVVSVNRNITKPARAQMRPEKAPAVTENIKNAAPCARLILIVTEQSRPDMW